MTSLLLINARIHTLDEAQPTASALAIRDGRIIAVGQSAALQARFADGFIREDLHGLTVLPGLIDAHLHLQYYAQSLAKVDCETATRAECLARIAERALSTPPGEWVLGRSFNQNIWPDGAPTAADLDAVAPSHPVCILHKSLHSAWANQLGLACAGLTAATPDPPGGRLGRTSAGALDGLLYEDAMGFITAIIPRPTPRQLAEMIASALPDLWRAGLTGVHDFDRRDCFAALQILHGRGELGLRVVKSIPLDDLPHAIGLGLRTGHGDDTLRIGSVKAFMDGALGPQTAAMLAPYEASADTGMLLLDRAALLAQGRLAAANGLSLAVHAIGDRAVREALDAFEQLRGEESAIGSGLPLRHRIEHVQLLHGDDVGRLATLDIIASMQPIHATSDMETADRHWGRRAALGYAWRSQLDHGARLAFGSDAPVESPNPFLGLHAAVTRQRADGAPGPNGWYGEQRLTLREALLAYTTGPAYAAGMEDRLGRLAPGCLADLIVLDTDPFTCPAHELQWLAPRRTMVGGRWVLNPDAT
jgi:predicted amidohydrolase YtcJ